jgi:hypothetical protein
MIEALEHAARSLSALTVPVLVVAIVLQVLRGRRDHTPGASARAVACIMFVGGLVAAGLWAGHTAGVDMRLSILTGVALVLAGVLLRSDVRFWGGLAVLIAIFTAAGAIIVVGLGHNYDGVSGRWYGVRFLVAWAGPEANPSGPQFGRAATYLAVMRFGLPLASTVAIAWVAATRPVATRLERLGLVLLTGQLALEAFIGAAVSTFWFGFGIVAGLPAAFVIPGLLASLLVLFTVGPGAVTGIVDGIRWLRTTLSGVDSAHTLVTTFGDARSDPDPPMSLPRFIRGNAGWVQKAYMGVILAGVALLGALAVFNQRSVEADDEQLELVYEYVDVEQTMEGLVTSTVRGPDGVVLLVTHDERLVAFDPDTRELRPIAPAIRDIVVLGDDVLAVTAEPTPRAVWVGPDGVDDELVALTPSAPGHLATVAGAAFVGDGGGRLLRIAADGTLGPEVAVEPIVDLVAIDGELWTLHLPARATVPTTYHAVQHDPTTLVPIGEDVVARYSDNYLTWESGMVYDQLRQQLAGTYQPYEPWIPPTPGEIVVTGSDVPVYFHYDIVLAVFETDHGTWVVADDVDGTSLTPRSGQTGYIARWANDAN